MVRDSLIDPSRDIGRQEISYRGAVRSASLAVLDRFRMQLESSAFLENRERVGLIFRTKELNDYVRRTIRCSAVRRRKIVAAVLSAGVRNGWLSHREVGYWQLTDRSITAFDPKPVGVE